MLVSANLPYRGAALAAVAREVIASLAAGDAYAVRLGLAPPPPPLYETGVRYRPEPGEGTGREEWADPWTVAHRGWGDCDDLVRYRLRELWEAGEMAAYPAVANDGDNWSGDNYHIVIRRADGSAEDPARILKKD